MIGLLKKIFGTARDRTVRKYFKIVAQVNSWDEKFKSLSDEELFAKTAEFKERYQKGESLDNLLPEAYATVKATCRRLCGSEVHVSGYNQLWDMVPYDVQIVGAIALHYGTIAEMQTGEGKTLTASMPLYLNALTGKPVHLVTVNDYLARRDCAWMGPIFQKLGLRVAFLTNDVPLSERRDIYGYDVIYGTASEFGFDYLRDNSMASSKDEQCQRGYYFAIVDEIDSILIDEARTPLIISGPSPVSRQMYDELKAPVANLVKMQRDFCNHLATDAKKVLEDLGRLSDEVWKSLNKEDSIKEEEALKKLWLVNKGTPCNRILKRAKENPDLRVAIEKWETYFFSEQNKEEKATMLAQLFIIIDERSSEYELTDKGIAAWGESTGKGGENDFLMLDLGYEYAQIDNDPKLSDAEKLAKKVALREEDGKRKERSHNLRQMFRANLLMEKDVDYIVENNKIVIIDEHTGRPQPDRRFSDGLHQAIEAKEGVSIQGETQTYATITLQNYFRMYEKLAGMTGTAITEATEFKEIYKLEVLEIPTYCPCKREDSDDEIYMTEREKYAAILKEIKDSHDKGRPILIGTESVEISEKLSRILKQNKLEHSVLNAKNNANEAAIIADAGKRGAITLSTNMAGRGTDIKLSPGVATVGGLHVIGTARHESRRIDRQLRGRSGRLGDPGSSKFFVSFEDRLLRLFASPRLSAMLQRFRPPEGEPISAKILNKSIETAQKRVEQRNYNIRKHTLEYDDVMNKQRKEVYAFRNDILHNDDMTALAKDLFVSICAQKAAECFQDSSDPLKWRGEEFREFLVTNFPVTFEKGLFDNEYLKLAEIEKMSSDKIIKAFEQKLEHQKQVIISVEGFAEPKEAEERSQYILSNVLRNLMIRKVDELWQEHLLLIDHLRADVYLRSVGQKDPLLEFKHEAFSLFNDFSQRLQLGIGNDLFRFEMVAPQRRALEDSIKELQMHKEESFLPNQEQMQEEKEVISKPVTVEPKARRNDLCPCGSGKKYKKCCGATESVTTT